MSDVKRIIYRYTDKIGGKYYIYKLMNEEKPDTSSNRFYVGKAYSVEEVRNKIRKINHVVNLI